jgi:Family of unknown function (DUF5670)
MCLKSNRFVVSNLAALIPRSTKPPRNGRPCGVCGKRHFCLPHTEGDEDMLGLIAAVLIILWLLGFFAFHVSAGLIHILLIVGIVMLLVHLLRGRSVVA